MTREEAIKMAKADLKCVERDTSGQDEMCNSHKCDECSLNYERGNIGEQKEWLRLAIKALEQEPRWIPVSEDLPEDIKPVQITWKNNDPEPYYQDIKGKHFTGTAHYKDGKWYWYSDVTEDFLAEYGRCDICEFDSAIEVVAWMPMSEPYETRREGV